MKQKSKRQAAAELWTAYVLAMTHARDRALGLADVLERWLLCGMGSWRGFHEACDAANAYSSAVRGAQPYHFAVIKTFTCSDVVNAFDPLDVLQFVRELRGTAVPRTIGEGANKVATFRYADDGIQGYFSQELRSMRRFMKPRRTPEEFAAAEAARLEFVRRAAA